MKKILILTALYLAGWNTLWAKTVESINWTTSDGLQVSFYPAPEVPMLELRLAFRSGSAYDGENYGLSSLTASLIGDSSEGMSTDAIAERYEDVGAQFSADNNRDMTVFSLRSLTEPKALAQGTDTFIHTLTKATFSQPDFLREKQRQLTALAQRKESPNQVGTDLFFEKLYGTHPYAHPVPGTDKTLKAITREQVEQFYQQYYVAKNAYLVIVGAIDINKAKEIAEQLSRKMKKGEKAPVVPQASSLSSSSVINYPFPSSQTILRLGQLGITYHITDYFPLVVGNYILGGGTLVSRLAIEVREKRGLTYGVGSQFQPLSGDGPFVIGLSTKSAQAEEALTVTRNVLQGYLAKGPDEKELKAAKLYLTGSFPLALASNRQIADMLLRMAFYDLPKDYLTNYQKNIEQVSIGQIKTAMDKYLDPNKMLLVKVGRM